MYLEMQVTVFQVKLDLHKPMDVSIAVCDYTEKVDSDLRNPTSSYK
jgi:hypothetical protein